MNKFEKKSFLISFFLFFSIQLILIIFINLKEREIQIHYLNSTLKRELEICSYKLNCPNIKISFEKKSNKPILKLIKEKDSIYMLFDIPYLKKNYLKLSIPKSLYENKIKKIEKKLLENLFVEVIFIIISSIIFALYVLKPLKKAYQINETFIKDILHDFNTPLSSLKLNLYALKKINSNNKYIQRIEKSIETILKLQENLKSYLNSNTLTKESFDLKDIINEEIELYSNLFTSINVINNLNSVKLHTNKEAIKSIITNLISNAFKYNKPNGYIKIYQKGTKLYIQDSGIGIKDPKRVFERFYKENERGVGIGMNIVKKLCDELNIKIDIASSKDGTTIILDLKEVVE